MTMTDTRGSHQREADSRMEDQCEDLSRCRKSLAEAYIEYGQHFSIVQNLPELSSQRCHVRVGEIQPGLKKMYYVSKNRTWSEGEALTLPQAFSASPPPTFLLGKPGEGKSFTLLHLTLLWAAWVRGEEAADIPEFLKDVTLLLYLRPQDCQPTLHHTVTALLEKHAGTSSLHHTVTALLEKHTGTSSSVTALLEKHAGTSSSAGLQHFKHSDSVALIIDSLDEISHQGALIYEISQLIRNQKMYVVGGVRSNHPVLENLTSFDTPSMTIDPTLHFLHVTGFSLHHIHTYIELFFQDVSIPKHPDFIQSFKNIINDSLHLKLWLKTPLLLSVLSTLLREGSVELKDLKDITKLQIFSKFEELVLLKRGERMGEKELKRFHEYVLRVLMEGKVFSLEEMSRSGFDPEVIPWVNDHTQSVSGQVFWPHQNLIEFAAFTHLNDRHPDEVMAVLFYLVCEPELHHLLLNVIESQEFEEKVYEAVINTLLCVNLRTMPPPLHHLQHPPPSRFHRLLCVNLHTPRYRFHLLQCGNHRVRGLEVSAREVQDEGFIETVNKVLGGLKACSQCWMRRLERQDWEVIKTTLDTASTLINALPDTTIRQTVFNKTLGFALGKRLSQEGRGFLPVPDTTCCVSVMNSSSSMDLSTSHPSHLVSSRVLAVRGRRRRLEELWLMVGQYGGVYGQPEPVTSDHWLHFLHHLSQHGPSFTGKAHITFLLPPNSSLTPLLQALPDTLLALSSRRGLRSLWIQLCVCQSKVVVTFMERLHERGWQTSAGSAEMYFERNQPQKVVVKMKMSDLEVFSEDEQEQKLHQERLSQLNACLSNAVWTIRRSCDSNS